MLRDRDMSWIAQRRGGLRPGRVPVRNAIFNVKIPGKKVESFNVLGDSATPHTALHYFAEHGREGRVAAIWAEK